MWHCLCSESHFISHINPLRAPERDHAAYQQLAGHNEASAASSKTCPIATHTENYTLFQNNALIKSEEDKLDKTLLVCKQFPFKFLRKSDRSYNWNSIVTLNKYFV